MAYRQTGARLARYCDPGGINAQWPARSIPAATAVEDGRALLDAALAHNVLPAVARNIAAEAEHAPESLFSGKGEHVDRLRQQLIAEARQTCLVLVARNMVLADIARDLLAQAARDNVPMVLVKGLDFAETCYGGLPMRAFSDIDLLVAPDAAPVVAKMLVDRGFSAVTPQTRREAYTERQFVRRGGDMGDLLVEIHTDLAHAPKLRQRTSLTYEAYAGKTAGGVTMAARLILAAIHGSTSHLFERMQYLVDILTIVRRGVDSAELRARVDETGSLLVVRTGLDLTRRMFDCSECAKLLRALPSARHDWLASRLLTPATVVSAFGPARPIHSWRRQAFRVLMTKPV